MEKMLNFSTVSKIEEAMTKDGYDMETVKAFYLYDPYMSKEDLEDSNARLFQPKCMDVKGLQEYGIFSISDVLQMFAVRVANNRDENINFVSDDTAQEVMNKFVEDFERDYPFKSLVSACLYHKDTGEYQPMCICYGK